MNDYTPGTIVVLLFLAVTIACVWVSAITGIHR